MAEKLTRILYVEDEPDIQMVARLALEARGGFEVEICSSGREAVERAPAFAPQLVLLDVMMPGIDGSGTLKVQRALPQFDATPFVFMTAKVQPGEIREYKELGAVDVIPKPYDPMRLSAQIAAIWEHCHD